MNVKATIILFLLTTSESICQENPFIPYEYIKYSFDSSHYYISKPHRISQSYVIPGDIHGNTKVFDRAGNQIFELYRYFWEKETFLNSAGNTITSITYTSFLKDFDHITPPIIFYKNGKVSRRYFLADLILNIKKGYSKESWMYTNFYKGGIKEKSKMHQFRFVTYNDYDPDSIERTIQKLSHYTIGDSLYITTAEERTAVFDLNTGKIIRWIPNAYSYFSLNRIRPDSLRVIRRKEE